LPPRYPDHSNGRSRPARASRDLGHRRGALRIGALSALCALSLAAAAAGAAARDLRGDASAFHGDAGTLIEAIHTLEQSSGARVVDIRFAATHGHSGFDAVVMHDHHLGLFHLEQSTRVVAELDATSAPVWMLAWRDRTDLDVIEHARLSLSEAIRRAEQSQHGAPALAAGVAQRPLNPTQTVHTYTVLLDVDGHVQSVSVNDSTGEIVDIAGSLVG